MDMQLPIWNSGDHVAIEVDGASSCMYMRHSSRDSTAQQDCCIAKRIAMLKIPRPSHEYALQVVLMANGDAVKLLTPSDTPILQHGMYDNDWVRVTA